MTRIRRPVRGRRTGQFSKDADGGWLFVRNQRTYKAWRNEAGFVGRNWELHRRDANGWTVVEDMLPSRAACVEEAEADRS